MFVLSYVMSPKDGAKYGKATVHEPVRHVAHCAKAAELVLRQHAPHLSEGTARRYALQFSRDHLTGTDWVETSTGIIFRIDPEERMPNACGCCGRLVKHGEDTYPGTSYCDGCYTRHDDTKIECSPHNTAHPNPWTVSPMGARFRMEVITDQGDETGHDVRYTSDDTHQMWDDEDNTLIAWPGLTRDQIIEVTITEINKES